MDLVGNVLELHSFTPHLVPLQAPGRRKRGGAKTKGKEPNIPVIRELRGAASQNTYRKRPPSASEVVEWFSQDEDTNIGVMTGRESSIVVLDVDKKLPRGVNPPETVTASTGRGRHYYFRHSKPLSSRSIPGTGELKADGGYVVAPPSLHSSGRRYSWEPCRGPGEVKLAELPDWLEEDPGTAPRGRVNEEWDNNMFCRSTPPDTTLERDTVLALSRDPVTALELTRGMGAEAERVGSAFLCVRHAEETPSASLYPAPDGAILYHEFHRGGGWITLGQLYCEHENGAPLDPADRFGPGETWIWYIRALVELLGYRLPDVEVPSRKLPDGLPESYQRVYEGFLYLLRIQQAYEHGNQRAPFSWRFAARWCGLSKTTAGRAVRWLFENGYLREAGCTTSGTHLLRAVEAPATKREVAELRSSGSSGIERIGDLLGDLEEKRPAVAAGRGP